MAAQGPGEESPSSILSRVKRAVFGSPRDLRDRSIFHRIALVPVLAWIGLGADGLSSSSYGPEEAYRTLGEHTFLALGLIVLIAVTIAVIAAAYSKIIELFPHGGGGYIVATNLLGPSAGVVSGSALLIDYVLTIAVSIASAGDALFSLLPPAWLPYKLTVEAVLIVCLLVLNLRGVRESVLTLAPIFVVFLVTHVVLIVGGMLFHAADIGPTVDRIALSYHGGATALGWAGLTVLLLRAYSFGAGTYTGIEAVSNGLPIMREPRVRTGKRTMLYMGVSLAFTATGLLFCYLLFDIAAVPGKTMNAVLTEQFVARWPLGGVVFVAVTLLSEGALLVVGAQAGFIDGPRVLANMALDGWVPKRFAVLSDRLTTRNGVLTMGGAALVALFYTRGSIQALVLMYSINVFLTFSLSMLGMLRHWLAVRHRRREWPRHVALFALGTVLCLTILGVTVTLKFGEGGWLTVAATSTLVGLCFAVRAHYRHVGRRLAGDFAELETTPLPHAAHVPPFQPQKPTAAVLVPRYGGLGIHTVLHIFRLFPNQYRNLVFLSVGVLDSAALRDTEPVRHVQEQVDDSLVKYRELAKHVGVPSIVRSAIGTDIAAEAEKLCLDVAPEFPNVVFFAGKLVLPRYRWYHRLLHNDLALTLQKRLELQGFVFVVVPSRLRRAVKRP
jgi:amino acid transporter